MNLPTLVILLIVAAAVALAIRDLARQRKSGGCAGCPGCGSCGGGCSQPKK